MSGTKNSNQTETALNTALRMAAQLPPLARNTSEAAKRGVTRTRAWAAPQLERGGQVLQDQVAPKVSAALSSAAQHVDPGQPKPRQWRKVAAFSLLAAAGIVTALAGFRRRANAAAPAAEPADTDTAPADTAAEDTAAEDAAAEDAAPGPEEAHESATH
jgi:hypothetical protein